jgi:hypothetical protein
MVFVVDRLALTGLSPGTWFPLPILIRDSLVSIAIGRTAEDLWSDPWQGQQIFQ